MSGDLELNATGATISAAHELQARLAREERVERLFQLNDSEDDRKADWYLALHRLARSIGADSIRAINEKDLRQVSMTEDYLRYLPDVSVEDCKQLLAWRKWKEDGGKIDSFVDRRDKDWYGAGDEISQALCRLESLEVDDSVRDYLKHAYLAQRQPLISTRAHWHYKAYPAAGWDADEMAAKRYIEEFYSLAWAVATNVVHGPRNELRGLIMRNEEMASFLDLMFVGLRRIDGTIPFGGSIESKESVVSLAKVT